MSRKKKKQEEEAKSSSLKVVYRHSSKGYNLPFMVVKTPAELRKCLAFMERPLSFDYHKVLLAVADRVLRCDLQEFWLPDKDKPKDFFDYYYFVADVRFDRYEPHEPWPKQVMFDSFYFYALPWQEDNWNKGDWHPTLSLIDNGWRYKKSKPYKKVMGMTKEEIRNDETYGLWQQYDNLADRTDWWDFDYDKKYGRGKKVW